MSIFGLFVLVIIVLLVLNYAPLNNGQRYMNTGRYGDVGSLLLICLGVYLLYRVFSHTL